ncbi:MAG: amidohydrolase family protein [Armatimonadota bacterium]
MQIVDANTMIGIHPAHRLEMTVEHLTEEMDKHGIAAGLCISMLGVFHDPEIGNAAILEAAARSERLVPVATVNPARCFGKLPDLSGFRIVKFYPYAQGWPIDSPIFARVLSKLSLPIIVSAAAPGEPTAVARAAKEHSAPVILGSISAEVLAEALAVMAEHPNVMIETHELHAPGALEMVAEQVGAERIVFGSGAPRRSIACALGYVRNSDLADAEKEAVLGGNIRRVLEAV